ncbi:hypothetical protein LPJ76_003246 [Coemansia sp. RSA 638]|nr:hypothetical protein LPJ76_003246 [Coemansia sp. RSA 638]
MTVCESVGQDYAFAQAIDVAVAKLQSERQDGLGFASKSVSTGLDRVESSTESNGYGSDTSMTREIMGEATESRTVSGVDFDEWMQTHAVLETEQPVDDEYYDDDDGCEPETDVRAAWMNAKREWADTSMSGEETECIALSSDSDSDTECTQVKDPQSARSSMEITATNIGHLFDSALAELPLPDPHTDSGHILAAEALSFLCGVSEQDAYERPPVPPSEQSIAEMAQAIVESLERSAEIANEVLTVCEQVEDPCTADVGTQTTEPCGDGFAEHADCETKFAQAQMEWNVQKTDLNTQIGRLSAQVAQLGSEKTALQAQLTRTENELSQVTLKLAQATNTNTALHAEQPTPQRSLVAQPPSPILQRSLEELNTELSRQCAELTTRNAHAHSHEQRLIMSNRALEAQLNDTLRLLRVHRTPSAQFLEQQRVCDAQLVDARKETKSALEQLQRVESELRDARRCSDVLRKRLVEVEQGSPVRGAKKRKVDTERQDEALENIDLDMVQEMQDTDTLVLRAGEHARERRRSPVCSPVRTTNIAYFDRSATRTDSRRESLLNMSQPVTPRIALHSTPTTPRIALHSTTPTLRKPGSVDITRLY